MGFLRLEGKVADIGKIEHVRALMRYILGLVIMFIGAILDIPVSFPIIFGCIALRLGIFLRMGIRAASIVILLRCRIWPRCGIGSILGSFIGGARLVGAIELFGFFIGAFGGIVLLIDGCFFFSGVFRFGFLQRMGRFRAFDLLEGGTGQFGPALVAELRAIAIFRVARRTDHA